MCERKKKRDRDRETERERQRDRETEKEREINIKIGRLNVRKEIMHRNRMKNGSSLVQGEVISK